MNTYEVTRARPRWQKVLMIPLFVWRMHRLKLGLWPALKTAWLLAWLLPVPSGELVRQINESEGFNARP